MDHVIQLNSYDDCQKKKTNAMSIITGSNNSRRDQEGGSEDCAKSNISSVSGGDSNNSVAESSISIDGLSSSGRRRASRGDFRLSDSTRTAGDTARGESAATTSSLMYRHESPQHEQLSEETSSQRSSFRRKSEIVLEELTINKLRLADVGFYGRESEQKILKEALERCHSSTKEVVWIYGYSGSGKTTLARSIMKQRQQPQKGKQQDVVFVESKFDMLSSLSEPLSGILSICSQLCQEVIERLDGTSNSEKVRMELEDQLGKEQVYMLTNILPELQYFALEKDHQREEAVSESAPNTISTSRHKTMDERTDVVAGCPANHDNDSPDKDTDDWTMGTSHSTSTEAQTQQLKYCLRVLLRVMMSHIQQRTAGNGNTDIDYDSFGSTVVVLLLDDLQWGSSEELQILKDFLLNDNEEEEGGGGGKGNKAKPSVGLLILGCYRSNEVHHEEIIRGKSQQEEEHQHPMCQLIDDLNYHSLNVHQSTTKNGKNNHVLKLTSVEVGNLKIVDCNQIIMDLLSIDDCERTIKLATLCHQRTLGNAYFLTQFVVMLYDYGLLEYNLGLLQWNWNLSQIEQKTSASPNVVTLVKERMQNTSNEPLRHFLKVLSCLGPLPSYRVIAIAWSTKVQQQEPAPSSHEDKVVTNNTKTMATTAEVTVDMLIEDAMESNYIERSGGSNTNHFRFVHDKILEASLAIMTEEEKRILRYRIGIQLWNELTEKEIESEIFLITDLINSCPLYSDPDNHGLYNAEQRLDHDLFIDLNLRSAEKAKELSSFSSSLKYAMEGISVLSQQATCWQNKYDTSLRLYSVGAETSGSIGQVDLLDDICQVALHRNDVPIFDKLRIYNALLDSMASNGKLVEAQTLVCDLLNQLGCRVPRPGMTQALRTLWSISTLNRNPPSKEAIQVLPKMINRNQSECLRLLYQLQTFSYLNREVPLFLWSCTRQVQLTMKYGVHELSAAAFPAMGAIMVALFSDFQTGALFAQNGRLIVDLWGHKVSEARVAFGCVIAPAYYQPMQSLVKGLSASAKIGMQVGDTDRYAFVIRHRPCMVDPWHCQ